MARSTSTADVFHAIADPNRRALLNLLADGETFVGDLVERSGLSYSVVSQHLAILLHVRLVTQARQGQRHFYRVDTEPLRDVVAWTRMVGGRLQTRGGKSRD